MQRPSTLHSPDDGHKFCFDQDDNSIHSFALLLLQRWKNGSGSSKEESRGSEKHAQTEEQRDDGKEMMGKRDDGRRVEIHVVLYTQQTNPDLESSNVG